MRILLVASFFPPQHAVASLRTHSFARAWSAVGHDVTVLTTAKRDDQRGMPRPADGFEVVEIPYRGLGPVEWIRGTRRTTEADAPDAPDTNAEDAAAESPATHAEPGPVHRWIESVRSRRGIFAGRRMPDLTDGWVAPAIAWAREHGPWDLVVSSSGPYTPHLVAMALRRDDSGVRWVADFRDLWVDNHLGGGLWPYTMRERRLQRQVLATCDLAVTVSEAMASTLRASDGARDTPVDVVFNGFEARDLAVLDPDPVVHDAAGAVTPVRLVYTGTVHPHGQDASPLFEAIARRREQRPDARPIEVVVAGEPASAWRHWAERAGVPDAVRTLGTRSRDEALRWQRDADALISVAWSGPRVGGLSGKVFEYLAASPPILVIGGPDDAPIARLVSDCGRGLHLGTAAGEIVAALDALASDTLDVGPPDHERIGGFARDAQAARLLDLATCSVSADDGPSDPPRPATAEIEAPAAVALPITPPLQPVASEAARA